MACPSGTTDRYVLFLHTFPHPQTGVARIRGRFTFCLVIRGSNVTGVVEELGVEVTGTNRPVGGTDTHRLSLEFFWSPSMVFLDGFTFPDGSRREFLGRFIAAAPVRDLSEEEEASVRLFVGPDPGETGTGNGNNT